MLTEPVWTLPYAGSRAGEGLRPIIQLEMTYAPLRQAPVMLPVSSFVAEAYRRAPEVTQIGCVSVTETAAEKPVALTRCIAMERAGLSRAPDPTLVRYIYDLRRILPARPEIRLQMSWRFTVMAPPPLRL